MAVFSFPIRVYYEDTDAAGIVYYANYLKFAERARTEWLRSAGISQQALMSEDYSPPPARGRPGGGPGALTPSSILPLAGGGSRRIGFVVKRVEAEFFAPARLDDLLTITSEVTDMRKVRLSMHQVIYKGGGEASLTPALHPTPRLRVATRHTGRRSSKSVGGSLREREKIVELTVDLACVDRAMKPVALPEDIKKALGIGH